MNLTCIECKKEFNLRFYRKYCKDCFKSKEIKSSFCECGLEVKAAKNSGKKRCVCGNVVIFEKKIYALKGRFKKFEVLKCDKARRAFLIREFGNVCWMCDREEWLGQPIPLELDHINGNSDDHSQENLRILCPNCHAQTPTYKAKNKGRGSKARWKMYDGMKFRKRAMV